MFQISIYLPIVIHIHYMRLKINYLILKAEFVVFINFH